MTSASIDRGQGHCRNESDLEMEMEEDENASMCERILADLDNIFKRDAHILEFAIIDTGDSAYNKSPVDYREHNLGLEQWCVPHLHEFAYRKVLQFKLNSQRANGNDLYSVHQWTRILLLINPDFTTAWNLRREIITNNIQSYLDDLRFTQLVLTRKPKCASVFSYREWLLSGACQQADNTAIEDLVESELQVTLVACSQYSRNYYAWSHRTWLFTNLITRFNAQVIPLKMMDDLAVTEKWLESHVSDYSCFQHRQFLLDYLFKEEATKTKSKSESTSTPAPAVSAESRTPIGLLWNEFHVLNSLFPLYPEQESLLLHRRFLLNAARQWCPGQMDELKQYESDFFRHHISTILRQSDTSSPWQHELIKRYLAYLKRNLNWSFDT